MSFNTSGIRGALEAISFPLLELPKDILLTTTSMLETQSIMELSRTNRIFNALLPEMLCSNGSVVNLIAEVFEKGRQEQFFKRFSGQYWNIHTFCLKSETTIVNYRHINTKDIEQLVVHFPNIREIVLENVNITDEVFKCLIDKNSKITKLFFKFTNACSLYTEPEKFAPVAKLHLLESVDFSNTTIRDEALKAILIANRNIKEISLCKCSSITSGGFKAFVEIHSLEKVNFGETSINDEALIAIRAANPKIKEVHLVGCKNIRDPNYFA